MRIEPKGLIVVCVCVLAGCATGPAPSGDSRTRYKGDAVWNISLRDATPRSGIRSGCQSRPRPRNAPVGREASAAIV